MPEKRPRQEDDERGGEAAPLPTPSAPEVSSHPVAFLGHPLNSRDIDELTDIRPAGSRAEDRRAALALAIPQAKKSLRASDQIATDSHGRQRFHGAFTGGYSAGFFNTVDTPEGWTPKDFVSSRSNRQAAGRQTVGDFMDEEDLVDLPASTIVTLQKTGGEPTQKTGADPLAMTLGISPVDSSSSIGTQILRRMGWRPGSYVLGKRMIRANETLLSKQKAGAGSGARRAPIGPRLPTQAGKVGGVEDGGVRSQRSDPPVIDEEEDLWMQLRREAYDQAVKMVSRYMYPDSLRNLKTDLRGLGCPETRLSGSFMRRAAPASRGATEAFGIGVLEDAEEFDVYDAPLSITSGASDGRKENKALVPYRAETLSSDSRSRPSHESREPTDRVGAPLRIKFVPASKAALEKEATSPLSRVRRWFLRKFSVTAASVPPWFQGVHVPSEAEQRELDELHQLTTTDAQMTDQKGGGRGNGSLFRRLVHFLKETDLIPPGLATPTTIANIPAAPAPPPPTSVEKVETAKKPAAGVAPNTEAARKQPLWSRFSSAESAKLLASLSTRSNFVSAGTQQDGGSVASSAVPTNAPFADDAPKQKRYELFCLALEEKVTAHAALEAQRHLSKEAAAKERAEFGKAYREFRQRHPTAPLVRSGAASETPSPSSSADLPKKVFLRYTRSSYNWRPDKILCKRFGLRDPWEKREGFVDDRPTPASQTTSSTTSRGGSQKQGAQTGPRRRLLDDKTGRFLDELSRTLQANSGGGSDEKSSTLTTSDKASLGEEAGKEEEADDAPALAPTPTPVITGRPPMDLFQSIFGDISSDEDC